MDKIRLEVIAWSIEDVIEISKSNASRIELVADIEKGGLTPSIEIVKEASSVSMIPIRVMVRETDESFVYSDEIMQKHISFINEIKDLNIEGIVFGSLTNENKINVKQLEDIINAKGKLKLTFHRAFDELNENDFINEFNILSNYDVDTLLTSGVKENAYIGRGNIKKLVDINTISILPGKSISINNVKDIINDTGVDYVHVGYSIRDIENENGKIDINKINDIIKKVNE